MSQDVRLAFRLLGRSPGFTIVAASMLAIGIAANTVVFSLINGLYFRGPAFPDGDRLMSVSATSATRLCAGCGVGASYPAFRDWRERARAFASLEVYAERTAVVSAPLVPEQVRAAEVSGGFFATLRVGAQLGRAIGPADEQAGAPAVVLLGHRIWSRAFGGDASVVGRSLRVDGVPAQIVGVLPPRLALPESADLFLPFSPDARSTDRDDRRYGVVGRLRDDATLEDAQVEMRAIAAALEREYPAAEGEWSAAVARLGAERGGDTGGVFGVMMGAVGLMLAVACANLAALVIARSARRARELTVRSALGASRWRLVRQLVIESLVLGVLGGGLGLLLAAWGVPLAGRLLATSETPAYLEFVIDWRVLVFCAAAAVGSSLLVGLVPAFTATRVRLVDGLKSGGASAPAGSPRAAALRHTLIVGQLALVLILLAAAALLGRTFLDFVNRPKGYGTTGLVLAQVPFTGARFDDEAALRTAVFDLDRRMGAGPGGRLALSATHFIRGFGREARPLRVDGADAPEGAGPSFAIAVTSGFFVAHGLPMLAGRDFDAGDRAGAAPVAIVNRAMADALWPGRSALGGRVQLQPHRPGDPWRAVVGVVGNSQGALRAGARVNPLVYLPFEQAPGRPVDLTARTAEGVPQFGERVRSALRDVDPDQPLNNVRSAEEEHRREYWYVGVFASFYATFGGLALLLGVVGAYGVASQSVSERMREFGIRAALGADRRALSALVFGSSLRLAAVGAVLGLIGAALVTRFLGFLLFGANPADPLVLAGVTVLLIATVVASTVGPARRAARVDPVATLKAD
jgi:predicted permease